MSAARAIGDETPVPGLDHAAWEELRTLLRAHIGGYSVCLFGSRATGTQRRFSDLDLAILGGPVPWEVISHLRAALSESRLPIHVDVVDWALADEAFRHRVGPLPPALDLGEDG